MIEDLREQKKTLITYLLAKIKAEDYHAIADAAMDLREIEALLKWLEYDKQNKILQDKEVIPGNVGKL